MPEISLTPLAVFLSYAREDAEAARRIAEALRGFGVEVWFDQNELRGGDQWDQKIRGQIKACALFIPVISATTQTRDEAYFRLEWKLADDRSHLMAAGKTFIVPVVIDDTPEGGVAAPDSFSRAQWTRLRDGVPTPQFVEQVRKLLDRKAVAGVADPGAPIAQPGSAPPATTKQRPVVWIWIITITVLVAVVAAVMLTRNSEAAKDQTPVTPVSNSLVASEDDKSVAVLPFESRSVGGEDSVFLADGIQEDLINTLSRVPGLKVIARTAVLAYRDGTTPLSQIAAALHVTHLVEAGVQRAGDRVRVNVQLIRASDGEAVWSERYDRTLSATNIFDLQEEITSAVAATLQLKLGTKSGEKLVTGTTGNLAAYELFLKARKEWSEATGSTRKSIELFQEAIRLDPNYALAYGGLAEAYVTLSNEGSVQSADAFPKAKAAAERALELDSHIVQAYTALAEYAFHYEWNWEESEKAILRALAIDPNYAAAHARHAGHLRAWGRFEEAETAARRANQLSPTPNDIVGLGIKLDQRRWQEVLDLTAAYAAPDATDYLVSRAIAFLHLGRKDEALQRLEQAMKLYPDSTGIMATLGWAYGQTGEIGKARQIIEQLKAMAESLYISPLRIAKVAAGMNDRDLAFAQLEMAYEMREPNLPFIGEEVEFDPIRDDPRFRDLLTRLKLDVFFPVATRS